MIIEAIAQVKNIDLSIVGDGQEMDNLIALTKKLSVENRVKFLGRKEQDKLVDIYREHDVFILPSTNEGGSNTVLEAMACCMPLIISDTGGASDLIKGNGYILKDISITSIVEELEKMLSGKDALEKMGKESREMAEKLSWKNVANKYIDLYKSLS